MAQKNRQNQIDDCCTSKPKYKQIAYLDNNDNNKAMSNRRDESSVVLIRQENTYPQSEQVDDQISETLEEDWYEYASQDDDTPGTNDNEQQENDQEGGHFSFYLSLLTGNCVL
ncbi:hypothetical protein DAPPUDRAFT_325148 [Daphnia pulex]|uniref:Uncharacterized protein n=1 Tax=Daphnia pulex TaxID=6669 RepID=E9H3V3_DAPPU|nr:hypothetical protein DAPPUDRAFT_325148 [Daphnia pulex]|eukprot:EFX73591.1 hypothetical protein DAPPUDRAFT_325148 [Daphnia pulex]